MRKTFVLLCVGAVCLASYAQDTLPSVRIALLLPFHVEETQRDKNMDRFVDFYSGVLLAVYQQQASGMPIELYTYDVGKSVAQLQRVLAQAPLAEMDWIIGPVYAAQVKEMQTWSMANGVRTLLPFTSEVKDIEANPYILQFNPSAQVEAQIMTSYLRSKDVHCVFVQANENNIPESVRYLQNYIRLESIDYTYTTVHAILHDSLSLVLSDSKENVLLMNTERFANVRTVMPHLLRAAENKELTLLSRYAWQGENMALPQLYTSVFNSPDQVNDTLYYVNEYNRFFDTPRQSEHPCYDWLGYDLMTYVLQTAQKMQAAQDEMEEEEIICQLFEGLQSNINFERVGLGGYINRHIQVIHTK